MVNIGIIGCGHWGPNHIRVFTQLKGCEAVICSDLDAERLAKMKAVYPDIETTQDYKPVFENDDIHAVCVSTPTNTHYQITKEALQAGKHVLCEKPLALTYEESNELYQLAQEVDKILMVGHVFLFNAGILWLKEFIDSGELGDVQYAYATRTNLGPFRYDVNALWDLAPHDISIFNFLFNAPPFSASGRGHKCLGNTLEDLAFAALNYDNNVVAHLHVSWLDPKKVRQITVVGDKKMVVWDDLDGEGPIKVYDKYVEKTSRFYETYGEFQLLSKEGSITIPKIPSQEPLKAQGQFFLDCINAKESVEKVDGHKAGDVIKTLIAVQKSMDSDGKTLTL